MYNSKILIELVPSTCFYSNVRSAVSAQNWDIIRKDAYKRYNLMCSICNVKGRMEAHEIWHYNDQTHIQKLHDVVSVCNACHMLYHLGYASVKGKLPQSLNRLAKLNNWNMATTKEYVDIIFEIHAQRSQHQWNIDLTWLNRFPIPYTQPEKHTRGNR